MLTIRLKPSSIYHEEFTLSVQLPNGIYLHTPRVYTRSYARRKLNKIEEGLQQAGIKYRVERTGI